MQSASRCQVLLLDNDDEMQFIVRRSDQVEGTEMMLDDFTAECFKEFGDIFTEGRSLKGAANQESIIAAITNVSDLLKMVLDNYDSEASSFKCLLASSCSCEDGIDLVCSDKKVSGDIFAENYVFLSQKIFSAMRKTKAGNAGGSNIYRLVHCLVHQGGTLDNFQPYAYAYFTVSLQACMFSYVCCHSLLNLPENDESIANLPLSVLVFVYQVLLLLPEIKDTMQVGRSGFWGDGFSILRFFDVLSNVIMPIILLPIGVLLVLTAENLLEAVLSSTAVLFIPTLDNDIIELMGESDSDIVKKHIAQITIHQFADHFFRFQTTFEEEDGFMDLERDSTSSNNLRANGSVTNHNLSISIPPTAAGGAMQGAGGAGSQSFEVAITEPILVDLAMTGEDALLTCVVFDAFSSQRELMLNKRNKKTNSGSGKGINSMQPFQNGGGISSSSSDKRNAAGIDGFLEVSHNDTFQEVFFSESAIVSPNSLFTRMEYKIEETEPYAILYLKLWRLGAHVGSPGQTIEYRTKRYSDLYPTRRIEPGCFIITNIAITDCIDTLRVIWAPDAKQMKAALDFYTIFDYDDASEKMMKAERPPVTKKGRAGTPTPTRRRSVLGQKLMGDLADKSGYQSIR